MSKNVTASILGGLVGLVVGIFGGGFLGLVIGGTFFGWLALPNYPSMPGYELLAYIGAVLGVLIATLVVVIIALRFVAQSEKNT